MNIAIVANTSWYVYNFRRNLMLALQQDGHRVVAVGGDGEFARRLSDEGFAHHPVPFSGAGVHPLWEAATVWSLHRALQRERVDLVLSYTPKGNIYAALAGLASRRRQVMNVSGLGRAFSRKSVLSRLVASLYRVTMDRADWVFFQNAEDRQLFVERGFVAAARCARLPGSGVDLQAFTAAPMPQRPDGTFMFLMVARLLWDKGVREYVDAARMLRRQWPNTRFRLLGPLDDSARTGVPRATLEGWVREGVIDYAGQTDDIRPYLRDADCVVLPSVYREGVPRTLLEAAATARPVITTNSVGCRDAVDPGRSGLLCRGGDAADLAAQMSWMLSMPQAARRAMGAAGRAKMEHEFDEGLVIDAYRQQVERIGRAGVTHRQ
jgi:glycosyltransferase involved in cell wall biosynthesis